MSSSPMEPAIQLIVTRCLTDGCTTQYEAALNGHAYIFFWIIAIGLCWNMDVIY